MGSQRSQFWDTTVGTGDGDDTYGQSDFTTWLRMIMTSDRHATEAVIPGVGDQLAVSGSASPLTIASGSAYVNGFFFRHTAPLDTLAVPSPATGTTGHRVVLRQDAQTNLVRLALLSATDGTATPPAVTQSSQVWEVSLATLTITTSGVITVTDTRDYCHPCPALVYRRRGGSSSDWSKAGNTASTPGGMLWQVGARTLEWDDDESSDTLKITFPKAYSQKPLVWLTIPNGGTVVGRKLLPSVQSVASSSVDVRGFYVPNNDISGFYDIWWMAVGAE